MTLVYGLFSYDFDCPEVTLCSWQDIEIQLLTANAVVLTEKSSKH